MHRPHRLASLVLTLGAGALVLSASSCDDRAPLDFGRTPEGPGARVRFDLAHEPLPDVPLPNDSATWSDPTSRTGLRINASLIAPTAIERDARARFDRMEGWGTFSPISMAFDLAEVGGQPRAPWQAALDLANIEERHQGDDYDFEDDAIYLVNLDTGLPVPIDLGNGNYEVTLKRLDRYWANDTRATERNLAFETSDESKRGSIGWDTFGPEHDTDFDGVLDVPNLDDPFVCPDPDPICDDAKNPAYGDASCRLTRQTRDRCVADHLLTYYERETDTLVFRPLLPLDEMTKYAVVVTDRLLDANGDPVKSPFDHVFHATQRVVAQRVAEAIDEPTRAAYFGDLAGTGLSRVAFTWGFTTQPTVDDMKILRDGLFEQGLFSKLGRDFPAELELQRAVGTVTGFEQGATDPAGWEAKEACVDKVDNLYILRVDQIRDTLELAVSELLGAGDGPETALLLETFEAIDYIAVATFRSPFLLEGGPQSPDPKAAFNVDFLTGAGEVHSDEVQVFIVVPKETAQFQQPFDVNIYGHGYTGAFIEHILYAGNLAQHGLATVGINAMGHGLDLGDDVTETLAKSIFSGACGGPAFEALLRTRARDLDGDGRGDSGGDFWSSYLFHTRDGVRQSVLDHLQLVRILRTFGEPEGRAFCRTEQTGWATPASTLCDTNGDGAAEVAGDFDGNGVPDFGGPDAKYGTWGESLGGILSGIHGAIDAYVTAASPGSGGGGLTDIGVRSFQGGVIEAVLLRMWGPLLVTVPSEERQACAGALDDRKDCTVCAAGELSLRWVMPDVNSTGELEISCVDPNVVKDTTVLVYNNDNGELRCARVGDDARMRIGLPTTVDDSVQVTFYEGRDLVTDYGSCRPTFDGANETPVLTVATYGKGRIAQGAPNGAGTATCEGASCGVFQGRFYPEGGTLVAPAEGYGQIRQTPSLRRFLQLAQMALEPGDPVSFAPYYAIRQMTDPFGEPIASHAVLTVNTIGDMNVPLNSGIAFARATGALPFFAPDAASKYPEYVDYVTPAALYEALGGVTPNQDLINRHVIEGVTALARHPAQPQCVTSANADLDGMFTRSDGSEAACYPAGCATAGADCQGGFCDEALDRCVPNPLGELKCEEALFDADDLDEGAQLYFEQAAPVPHRLVRYTASALDSSIEAVWEPRLSGVPYGPDGAWTPDASRRVTGLLDAYVVPEGTHTFVNGNPCEAFDAGTYLTNAVARFFQSDGTDVYYLSNPTSHHCLAEGAATCGYLEAEE
ncbi:MAG: hypothetical protein IPG04_35005 [Polyangiaceae bacterium]|nr:hypothetical protein [Polyangiaceae bacterium]